MDCRVEPGNDLVETRCHTAGSTVTSGRATHAMRGLDPRIHDDGQRVLLDCRLSPAMTLLRGTATHAVMRGLDPRIHDDVQRVLLDCRLSPAMTSLRRGATLAGSTVTLWPRHTL